MDNTAERIRVAISSPPDRVWSVADLIVVGEQPYLHLAELNQDQGDWIVEMYPRPDGEPWRLNYWDFVTALTRAGQALSDRTRGPARD